jgi:TolB-like protein/Flp pilus assembly protein TadD
MSESTGFLEELKRRKVVRVVVVYLAVVWAVMQVADVFVPALGLSRAIITGLAVVAILGFPVAVALAWAFDVTPDGIRRTGEKSGGTPQRWIAPSTLLAAAVLVLVGLGVGAFLGGRGSSAPPALDRLAVAVLPFEARGMVDETGFVDGMHDDILTQLSRIQSLRVTSRTSVEEYRGSARNVREIAAALGVGSILEGGVQRTADRVRINVQLIEGATDRHLWAETYDRELTAENIFAIQSEIARAVAVALEATLTAADESVLDEIPTRNMLALDLYHEALRVRDAFTEGGAGSSATLLLEAAVREDPGFARAWAELTRERSFELRNGIAADTLPAREALDRTVELAPGSIEAALARASYLYYARGDFEGALSALQSVVRRQSAVGNVHVLMAAVLRRLGRWEEAIDLYEEARRREPRNARLVYELAWTQAAMRQWDPAEQAYRDYLALRPTDIIARVALADVALGARGDTAAARGWIEEIPASNTGPTRPLYLAQLAHFRRDPASLILAPNTGGPSSFAVYPRFPDGPLLLWRARMAWVLGDTAHARELGEGLEEAYLTVTPLAGLETNVMGPGEDHFAARASQLLLRAWSQVFAGRAADARRTANEAMALALNQMDEVERTQLEHQRMLIRVVSGDLDGAMESIRFLLARPGMLTPAILRLDPMYDPLRGRADFQALAGG